MKLKKLFFITIILLCLGYFGYRYVYQEHRDISKEDASYSLTVEMLDSAFVENETAANEKFLDKTIMIKGKITSLNKEEKSLVVDEKINCYFPEAIPEDLEANVMIKGRFIGYDELLNEYKVNECTFVKN